MGGMIALAGAIVLGPRLGRKFKRDGGGMPPGHDLNIAALGGVILWFGWYGFNPGSTLSAIDSLGIGRVATNTTLAAAAGGLVGDGSTSTPDSRSGTSASRSTASSAASSAITAPCYWVNTHRGGDHRPRRRRHRRDRRRSPRALPRRRSDRRRRRARLLRHLGHVGGRPVRHRPVRRPGVEGLFWGGGVKQLWAQIWGNVAIGGVAFVVMGAVFLAINASGLLRVWRRASSRASTSTSTARPPTTRKPAYMGQGLS